MPLRRTFVLVAVLTGMFAVSAHAETIQIVMDKLVYIPTETSAKVGDTVEWSNKDILVHTATATNGDWNVTIPPKKTERLILTKAGTIEYFCKFHPNMKGRIAVAPE